MAQNGSYEDGRAQMFTELMERFSAIQGKYKGVRGELLAKVREELEQLEPTKQVAPPARIEPLRAPKPGLEKSVLQKMLPSCRVCGRGMKSNGDGTLVCEKGHLRNLAG